MIIPFPQLPKYEASWSPVLWTPVYGSEEALMVGVQGEIQGERFVERIIPDRVLSVLCRSQKKQAASIIDFVIDSLNKQASKTDEELIMPLTGVRLGAQINTFCDDRLSLIEQAIMSQSGLTTFEEYENSLASSSSKNGSRKAFVGGIKELVISERADLEENFNVKKNVSGFDVVYSFYSKKLISQMGVLREDRIKNDTDILRRYVLDLMDARENMSNSLLLIQESFYDNNTRARSLDAFNTLARRRNIRFESVTNPEEGKEVILSMVA